MDANHIRSGPWLLRSDRSTARTDQHAFHRVRPSFTDQTYPPEPTFRTDKTAVLVGVHGPLEVGGRRKDQEKVDRASVEVILKRRSGQPGACLLLLVRALRVPTFIPDVCLSALPSVMMVDAIRPQAPALIGVPPPKPTHAPSSL